MVCLLVTEPWAMGWAGAAELSGSEARPLRPVSFHQVTISDSFWTPRRASNRLVSIPVNLANLEKSGNLENLRLAAARSTTGYQGPVFMDSDVYKALEAASYSLATDPDPALDRKLDDIIAILARAQHDDGYLNSHYTVKEPGRRWTNLRDNHELYCAGHLIEAAVAHHRATAKTNFLNVARRLADHIDSVFGPPPKRLGYPGHPEIELALVKLWRTTEERRYFELARFFVEKRGVGFFADEHRTPKDRYDGAYWQDDVPICDHRNIKGHAVRAAYLMSGATDVAAETGDRKLLAMLGRVWRNTVERNQYLTGGIGPSAHNEGFTEDYDLPNATAYQETCATIALAQWAHRLAMLHRDARYADVVERALYNGVLAGVSLDGNRFFYVNPLESRGGHHRSEWFGCACCPPNVARTLASLGGYAYATGTGSEPSLYVNLYVQGEARVSVGEAGTEGRLSVTTDYPWDGRVRLRWSAGEKPVRLVLKPRIPGWCRGATARVNGQPVDLSAPGAVLAGYLNLDREWRTGDTVELEFPMPVERMVAHPNVKADRGLSAFQRGPLVYCLEQADLGEPLETVYLPAESELRAESEPGLLGGIVVLKGTARVSEEEAWSKALYRPAARSRTVPVMAIPYAWWDNRKAGAMKVWIPGAPSVPPAGGVEMQARVSLSYRSGYASPDAVRDGKEPEGSRKHPGSLCHWWPHKGGREWVQYEWSAERKLEGARVYWFDDTGTGECRLPSGWSVEYLEGADWKPVKATGPYAVALDRWCEVKFAPVRTKALRLLVSQPAEWATGIHEWRVLEADED